MLFPSPEADAFGEVKAQRRGSDVKHLAKVLSVGWECDAAVLTVENDELPGWWKMVKMIKKDFLSCVGDELLKEWWELNGYLGL